MTIVGHSLGGFISTVYTGLYPDRVRRLVNIEGLGLPPSIAAHLAALTHAERLREWIDERRRAAGRLPRRYATIAAAYARMKDQNGYLSDAQARHLTLHAIARNEDGTWSWKFDPYLHTLPMADMGRSDLEALIRAITCPVLLLYGKDSWAPSPAGDGRLALFADPTLIEYERAGHWLHHDQTERFLGDVAGFL